MIKKLSKLSSGRIIALGFMALIFIGSVLLIMPFSIKTGQSVNFIDALYTAASAVCVTGLATVDVGDTFTAAGQLIIIMLIQIGGLGVTSIGAGVIVALGRRVNLKGRNIIKEAMNLNSGNGIVEFLKEVFKTTLAIELLGAVLSFFAFSRDYSAGRAAWISIFHAISAFNNAGFDILGGGQSLSHYKSNVWLNIVTCMLIFFGSIGFLVIREMRTKKLDFKRYSLHSKVALTMSIILIAGGTVLMKFTEGIPWLGALFASVTARTAGFSTYSFGNFTSAGLMVMMVLMFIGASSGSTGGGVKTGTIFVLVKGVVAAAANKNEKAFKYAIPREAFKKAAVVSIMAVTAIMVSTFLILIMDPQLELKDVLFEMVSAAATVGLTTGITSGLGIGAKIVTIIMMYIGRLGPLTIAALWYFSKGERVELAEGNLPIG